MHKFLVTKLLHLRFIKKIIYAIFDTPFIRRGHRRMGFNSECPNELDGTDVTREGGWGDNNNTCAMNNMPNIWSGTNIRYG